MNYTLLVKVIANYFACSEIIALGTLINWLKGKTALDSRLVDLEVSMNGEESIFAPLREAYFEANGAEQPPLSLTMETANTFEIERLRNVLKSTGVDVATE